MKKSYLGLYLIILLLSSCGRNNRPLCVIPFEIVKNQIIIKLSVNNSDSLNFIFDTGNENAHIDTAVADSLGLIPYGSKEMHCSGSIEYIPLVMCDFSLDDLHIDSVVSTTGSLSSYSRVLKRKIDGIIGQDLLREHIVMINFTENRMEIYSKNYVYKGKGQIMPIIDRGPSILAEIILANGDKIKGKFILDTGSNSSITLSTNYTDTTRIKEMIGEYKRYTTYDMCGNSHPEYEGRGKDILLGSSHTGSFPLTMSHTEQGVLAENTYSGLIGVPVLRCFNLVIDYDKMKVFFEPNEALKEFSRVAKH
jgi:hypothetical protein